MPDLQTEIQQTKPFESMEVEVYLNMTRTQALLSQPADMLLKTHGLTRVTYNILRILRGAGAAGISCCEIQKRLLARVPDVTRLVDRMVELGLAERVRTDSDRRLVLQLLTPKGADLLTELQEPLLKINKDQFSHMTKEELKTLNQLLTKARQHAS